MISKSLKCLLECSAISGQGCCFFPVNSLFPGKGSFGCPKIVCKFRLNFQLNKKIYRETLFKRLKYLLG